MTKAREVIAKAIAEDIGRQLQGESGPYCLKLQADSILSALAEAGFQVVPVEPTQAMINAAMVETATDLATEYRAMLAAVKEG